MTALIAGIAAFALVCCSFAAVAFGCWLFVDIRRVKEHERMNERRNRWER